MTTVQMRPCIGASWTRTAAGAGVNKVRHSLATVQPRDRTKLVVKMQAHKITTKTIKAPKTAAPPARGAPVDRRAVLLGLIASTQLLQLDLAKLASAAGIETVFVAGSTGNTGRRVVQQLRASGYNVRAGVRDVKKAQGLGFALDKGITIVEADVTKNAKTLAAAIGDSQAVICATGYAGLNPLGVGSVDETGTIHLIDAAKVAGVKDFVLLSSLLTNAAAVGQKDNPNYKFLNLFGGVLDHKLAAEKYLRSSGLQYTIVRAGGLSSDPPSVTGNLLVSGEDTLFGLDTEPGRVISRDTVAAVLVAALQQPSAANKVVEVVASPAAPALPEDKWFLA